MRPHHIIFAAFFILNTVFAKAQDTVKVIYLETENSGANTDNETPAFKEQYYFSNKKEIGLDVTGLLAQLTPFNTVKAPNNMVGFKFKKYGRRFAYRLSFGFDITERDENNLNFFYFSSGYERRRILGKKFAYNSGWEGVLGVQNVTQGETFVGIANFHGIDFNVNEMIFVGIETQLRLTIANFGPNFKLIPPTAVFFNVRF